MSVIRFLLMTLLVILVLGISREGHAVIYQYVNEKGDILIVDDLQKIPEQKRASAVMVSGAETAPEQTLSERTETAARMEAARLEQVVARQQQADSFRTRLSLSLGSIAAVVALFFIMGNIDALRSHATVLHRVQAGLVAVLIVLLAVIHYPDAAGLFQKAGGTVAGTFSDIQDRQEARGRKAGEAIKALNTLLEQAEREREQHPERRIEEAEQGR